MSLHWFSRPPPAHLGPAVPEPAASRPDGHSWSRAADAACEAVAQEIGRTDGKASLLLAFDGALLAGLASLAPRGLPLLTVGVGAAAVLALAGAAVLLLLVVRPRLGGTNRASFPYWAQLDDAGIRDCLQYDMRLARIRVLSVLVMAKYRRLQGAVDLSLAALVLLALAAATTLT
ncbi:Pycsar system effector family protein [Streptomyces sp. NPDC005574]|uniref:Pycsar system effector family protein n=1 Tax=Streptomyces sp. NPDC005574 TaxID=3156891 RepID=UPI0033A1D6CC